LFDLTAGTTDRPFRDAHASATVLSIAAHVLLLGGVAWVVLSSVTNEVPNVPSMVTFVAEAAAPSPPPPPPPALKAAKAAEVPKTVLTASSTLAVPAEIPVGIQPESSFDPGDEGGATGGVDGGIEGGVLGGVLGGMINEAPPPPSPAPAPAPSKPRRVGGDLQAPALVHRVEPAYPGVAVAANVTGSVILEATVNEAGAVTDVRVLRSILLLDQAAIKAVKQWRYQPLVLNGEAVPFILVVTVSFSLR